MQTDECVPPINNKRTITEKTLLNTVSSPIELLEGRRHTLSRTARPTPTVNSSQERPDLQASARNRANILASAWKKKQEPAWRGSMNKPERSILTIPSLHNESRSREEGSWRDKWGQGCQQRCRSGKIWASTFELSWNILISTKRKRRYKWWQGPRSKSSSNQHAGIPGMGSSVQGIKEIINRAVIATVHSAFKCFMAQEKRTSRTWTDAHWNDRG